MDDSVAQVARKARRSTPLRFLARAGFAVNGILHILIGAIAIALAFGSSGGEADQSGALRQLSGTPGGAFVIWAVVVGMFALGLWLVLSAFLTVGADAKRKWGRRLAELGKAVAYLALGGAALTVALGGTTDAASSASSASAKLLATPGGVFVLFAAGVLVLGIGGYFVYKGVARKFTEDLALPSGPAGRATVGFGVFGYVSKGVAVGVVGVLVIVAAFTLDPSKSTGLDGALRSLAALPFGMVILVIVGAGLIAYGLYCFVRARRARL
ncbi:DUF1206 domain-containing protein [Glaciibacter sp. 2TAF33]|uniref:DUF1206 domain-containing protein n=1 Tax=Glaciibacter sp. 2TAF33 TaxID=3233015 RepID=UPI003F92CDC1